MRPFLKWAGNKYRIVDKIKAVLPEGRRLVEPFAGSAAVFMNTEYAENLVTDANPDLISLYQTLKREGQSFIDYVRSFFAPINNQSEIYYQLRQTFNETPDKTLKAALFVYLNRHGYNGLCRYNRDGGFNVPFGRYVRPYFPEAEMQAFVEKAKTAEFDCADYRMVMRDQVRAGDVVYCDPPYVPLSDTANFTSYSAGGFGREAQLELAKLAQDLGAKGVPVVISNHENAFTREAYAAAKTIRSFPVQRFISCDGANRGTAAELLAVFDGEKVQHGR